DRCHVEKRFVPQKLAVLISSHSADLSASCVAQIFNLLYRRIAFGSAPEWSHGFVFSRRFAECNSAIRQSKNSALRRGVSRTHMRIRLTGPSSCFTVRNF